MAVFAFLGVCGGILLFMFLAIYTEGWFQNRAEKKLQTNKIYVQVLEEHIAESGDGFILFSCKFIQNNVTTFKSYVVSGPLGPSGFTNDDYIVYSHPDVEEVYDDERKAVESAHRTWMHIKARNLEINKIKKQFSADNYRRSA